MLNLNIPILDEDAKNVKDLVIRLLTVEQPLSLIELTNRIRKQHRVSVTYQAVRKAVDNLLKQKVLNKEDKKYQINKKWLVELKTFADNLLTQYDKGKKTHLFSKEFAKEDYAVYTFNNLLDLDTFWGDVFYHWADHLKKDSAKEFVALYHYGFWFLINLGRETRIYEEFKKKGVKMYILLLNDTPLNKWGLNIYGDIGMKTEVTNKLEIQENVGLNIIGDTVIQVKYPEKIVKKLKKFYKKYKSIQDMSHKEITAIAHEPCEVKFAMFKNPIVAKNLREMYKKKYFGK